MSIKRGLEYEKQLRQKDKEVEKNRYRAGQILGHYAEIDKMESGRTYEQSFKIQLTKFPGLRKSYLDGTPLPDSGEEREVIQRFYGKSAPKPGSRVYSH